MKYRYIAGDKYKQFRSMNLWIECDTKIAMVVSYDTPIGIIRFYDNTFTTWGYGRYSRTTSKQITILCASLKLKRIDIDMKGNN